MIKPIQIFEEPTREGNVLLTAKLTIFSQCVLTAKEIHSDAIDHKKHKVNHLVKIIDQDFIRLKGMGDLVQARNRLLANPFVTEHYNDIKPIVDEIEKLIYNLENITYDVQYAMKD